MENRTGQNDFDPSRDRRRYYRIHRDVGPRPQAEVVVAKKKHALEVVNFSPGGLLCYLPETDIHLAKDQIVPEIWIRLPEKEPVLYAGRVLRLEWDKKTGKRFCAIEFIQYGSGKILRKGKKPLRPFRALERDRDFLDRLRKAPPISLEDEPSVQMEKLKVLYRLFQREAERLPIEERWYFYEVLEEMKRKEPHYPEGLKREFLRLCRAEDRSEFFPSPLARFRKWLWKLTSS
jgi:hypothetical protein